MSTVRPIRAARPRVLEFFAGIGLARMGLERAGFQVSWANDIEPAKWKLYRENFPDPDDQHRFVLGDLGQVGVDEVPRDADIAWGSSPCTDLSLAGSRQGLNAGESNAFWQYIRLLDELGDDRPPVVVLENVVGLATSHGGDDLTAAVRAFNELGYSVDVFTLDARRFVPQSRPRLFLVGVTNPPVDTEIPHDELRPAWLAQVHADPTLRTHRAELPAVPPLLTEGFGTTVETMPPDDARWWDTDRTERFLSSLSVIQADRLAVMMRSDRTVYRTAYRRTRAGVAVWEIRPDDISGCLRTARGGSSKQAVVQVGAGRVRVRWMTPLEYARLMGAPDYGIDQARPNQVYFAFGDAVAVPVVEWIGRHYLMPALRSSRVPVGVELAAVGSAGG